MLMNELVSVLRTLTPQVWATGLTSVASRSLRAVEHGAFLQNSKVKICLLTGSSAFFKFENPLFF